MFRHRISLAKTAKSSNKVASLPFHIWMIYSAASGILLRFCVFLQADCFMFSDAIWKRLVALLSSEINQNYSLCKIFDDFAVAVPSLNRISLWKDRISPAIVRSSSSQYVSPHYSLCCLFLIHYLLARCVLLTRLKSRNTELKENEIHASCWSWKWREEEER